MKKDQITLGGTYLAKVTDKVVPVRLDSANPHGGWDATNLATNKKIRIKSAQRLRGPADRSAGPMPQRQANAAAVNPDLVPLTEAMKPVKANSPTAKATKGTKAKAAEGPKIETPKKASGLDAAAEVLSTAGQPMRCKDMVEKMLATGLWKTGGKTPAATIYSAICREIQTKGGEARFKKLERGLFTTGAK